MEDAGDSGTPPGGEQDPETFPREYVEELRAEAAEHRTKAKRAEDAETRLRELAIAQAVQGILTDPTDLGWSEEYGDAEGWPDPEKIKAAAEGLIDRKPHLARPTGDIGQGRHSEPGDTVSLVGLLGS
ncbi:hypothetical protein ASG90_20535 [Nocardioides sp. Soil797]|nr:hypothetical protein ASG90_20535 [Nocardioides sp. Soil797]